jgi:hypothetical protein
MAKFFVFIIAILVFSASLSANSVSYGKAFAKQQLSALANGSNTNAIASSSELRRGNNNTRSNLTTFTASGLVASWAENRQGISSRGSTASTNVVPIPYDIAGAWDLQISKGQVKSFDANLTMVKGDGSDYHTHRIFNFKPLSHSVTKTILLSTASNASSSNNLTSSTLELTSNSTLSIPGTADISTNNKITWSNVSMTIFLRKDSALNIMVDANATNGHFTQGHYAPAIYGIVYSIKDSKGSEFLGNPYYVSNMNSNNAKSKIS